MRCFTSFFIYTPEPPPVRLTLQESFSKGYSGTFFLIFSLTLSLSVCLSVSPTFSSLLSTFTAHSNLPHPFFIFSPPSPLSTFSCSPRFLTFFLHHSHLHLLEIKVILRHFRLPSSLPAFHLLCINDKTRNYFLRGTQK